MSGRQSDQTGNISQFADLVHAAEWDTNLTHLTGDAWMR